MLCFFYVVEKCENKMLFYSGFNVFKDIFDKNENNIICDELLKFSDDITNVKIQWNYVLIWKQKDLYISGNFKGKNEMRQLIIPGDEYSGLLQALPGKDFVTIITSHHRIYQYNVYEQKWKKIDDFIHSNDEISPEFIVKIDNNSSIVALTNLGRIFNVPVLINMSKRVKFIDIACGFDHTIMLTENGDVYSLGMGTRGQLGNGDLEDCDEATLIEALAGLNICQIAAGGWHSAALTHDGDLYTWGWNTNGELGLIDDERIVASPAIVEFKDNDGNTVETNIKKVQCGNNFTVCLSDDGALWGCGSNKYGQLGQCPKDLASSKLFIKLKIDDSLKNIKDIYCNEWGSVIFT